MERTQLLLTFTRSSRIEDTINQIQNCYELAFNRIFILQNVNDEKELICSYNILHTLNNSIPPNTVLANRCKNYNVLYTINALNYIVLLLNDGVPDPTFPIPWENYRNSILVTNQDDGLKKISTKVFSVLEL